MKTYLGMKANALKARLKGGRQERVRIDAGLPFNLRAGSRIQFSEAPFLLAGDEFGVAHPGAESLVAGYSQADWAGLATFRIHAKDRATGGQCLLLFVMGDAGAEELYLFTEQTQVPLRHVGLDEVAEDGDEVHAVDFWIGKPHGIIGMPLFHTPDELTYHRLWEADNDARIPPVAFREEIHWDAYGERRSTVEHLGEMLYARTAPGAGGGIDEYLLPAVERDDAGFRVRVRAGMALTPADLSFPDAL